MHIAPEVIASSRGGTNEEIGHGGLAEKRIFGRSLLAFTLAATLAFPAASLSFVAQAFADDPSNGDAAEAPAAPVVDPIKHGDVHGIDFMTPRLKMACGISFAWKTAQGRPSI